MKFFRGVFKLFRWVFRLFFKLFFGVFRIFFGILGFMFDIAFQAETPAEKTAREEQGRAFHYMNGRK